MLRYQILAFKMHGKIIQAIKNNKTHKNNKKSWKNNKFKISAPTWNEEFELPDGSYSVSDIQENFEYIFKKHGVFTDNPSIMIYVNKIENKITLKIKTGYYLLMPLMSETMTLIGNTKSKITGDENGENAPHLEITEVELIHCNTANNDYQQDLRVLCTFALNKLFHQLLDISSKNFTFLYLSEFSYIEVWFTDQNCKTLEIEDKINITLLIS